MNNTQADSYLVSQYLSGDEKSLEILIDKHKSRIFNFIYSKVLDRYTSEDIFQETFIKVIKTLKKGLYNEEGKFLPWVMRISHNLIIDYFRHNSARPEFYPCWCEPGPAGYSTHIASALYSTCVRHEDRCYQFISDFCDTK